MTTYCLHCVNVHLDSMKQSPHRWLCTKHKRLNEGFGFVTPDTWDNAPPFLFCKDVNAGACPLYEEAVKGQKLTRRLGIE